MVRGSLDFDLEPLHDAFGNLAERRRTSILSSTREVDILEDEGFRYTRWLDTRFNAPSGGYGLGWSRRSWRRRQGREGIVRGSIKFLLRKSTGSRRSRGSRTSMPRQAGEWIWGTLKFMPLLLTSRKSRTKAQWKIQLETFALSQRIHQSAGD